MLKAYIDKAVKSESHTFLIGGVFIRPGVAPHARSLLWLENRMAQLRHTVGSRWFDIRATSSEHLCVLPWCATGSMKCIALDATGPYILVFEHEPSSAERPATSTHRRLEKSQRISSAERPAASKVLPRSSSSAERPAASSALPLGCSSAERPATFSNAVHPALLKGTTLRGG